MKNSAVIRLKHFSPLCFCALVLFSACAEPILSKFEVDRSSRITVPREVKKEFIRSDLVADTNDLLGIKSQVFQQLVSGLNRLGRFKISVVDTFNESQTDSEKDTVAIVQGEVTSEVKWIEDNLPTLPPAQVELEKDFLLQV